MAKQEELLNVGSAGLHTQMPGSPTTVTGDALATGGVGQGGIIERDIDEELFSFKSDDTPLMQLMLKAKKIKVESPEVEHFMIDEPRTSFTTNAVLDSENRTSAPLPLEARDQNIPRPYTTLLVHGVNGYTPDGQDATPGKPLMLFVTGHDNVSGNPIVRAVNGPRDSASDEECLIPEIPAGTKITILANALYETQKEVDPDNAVPQKKIIYLQKRGMNTIISDYFEAQRKRIPFGKALLAEQAITNFKVKGNRTLWASRPSKFTTQTPKVGRQTIYTTEGVRWQVKKELDLVGDWTVEKLIALTKMFFTGEDVPKTGIVLAGKNFLEKIQCIDFTKHPEIQVTMKTNSVGWKVTNVHTVFGDLEFKHEPTLDRLLWSNSALVLAEDRLVHYVYSQEHTSTDRIDGEEATRTSVLTWDALALKGSCHIWINGEDAANDKHVHSDKLCYYIWDAEEAPQDNITSGHIFYLLSDCPGIGSNAVSGTMWRKVGGKWQEYSGELQNWRINGFWD